MIDLVASALAAWFGVWLVRGWQRRRAESRVEGSTFRVTCMLKTRSPRRSRWMRGRLVIDEKSVVWEPASRRRMAVLFGDGPRELSVRSTTMGEWMWINPRCQIVECESTAGGVALGVMPEELGSVVGALGAVASV